MVTILDTYNKRSIIGENIRRLRRKANPTVSQDALARVAGFGKEKMRKIEEGVSTIMHHQLVKIAKYLNVPVEIFTSDNQEQEDMMIEINDILRNRTQELDNAISMCHELINFYVPGMIKYANACNLMGKLYLKKGLFKQAYEYFYTYYEEVKPLQDKTFNYIACYNVALSLYYLKKFDESMFYVEEGLSNKYSNDRIEEIQYIHLRALLLLEIEKYYDAVGVFNELICVYEKENMKSELLITHHNISWSYLKLGNLEKAIEQYKLTFEMCLSQLDSDQASKTCFDLARIYYNIGHKEKAVKLIERTLDFKDLPVLYEIRIKYILAVCLDDIQKKIEILENLVVQQDDIPDNDLLSELYVLLARLYSKQNDFQNSIDMYEKACKALKNKDIFKFY